MDEIRHLAFLEALPTQLSRLIKDEAHAVEAVKALMLEAFTLRHERALFSKRRIEAWPTMVMGVQVQLILEHEPDTLALSCAGVLPSHRKSRAYFAHVCRRDDHTLDVSCATPEEAAFFFHNTLRSCYPV